MNYNSFLDLYFSTYAISMGLPIGLVILYHVFRRKLRKDKEYTFTERNISIGVTFVMIMIPGLVNPSMWGYGKPDGVKEIHFQNGKLIVIDYIMSLGSETDDGDPYGRIHVVNPETGEKLRRFVAGVGAEFVGITGDTLIVTRYSEAGLYSLTTGAELAVYSAATLPDYFQELSSGVNNIMWGDGSTVMEITANNGKQYDLMLKTCKLLPASIDHSHDAAYQPTRKLYATDDEIKRDDVVWGSIVLQLDGNNGNQYELYLKNSDDSVLNAQTPFLNGEFAGVSERDSSVIILSYETLENRQYVLTSVSLDGKTVNWQIHQRQYDSKYQYSDYVKPAVKFDPETNTVCFAVGTVVYCVDGATSNLLWQTSL